MITKSFTAHSALWLCSGYLLNVFTQSRHITYYPYSIHRTIYICMYTFLPLSRKKVSRHFLQQTWSQIIDRCSLASHQISSCFKCVCEQFLLTQPVASNEADWELQTISRDCLQLPFFSFSGHLTVSMFIKVGPEAESSPPTMQTSSTGASGKMIEHNVFKVVIMESTIYSEVVEKKVYNLLGMGWFENDNDQPEKICFCSLG